jgi:hypothetical protein
MSEFSDDLKAIRILLAEQGIEVTLEKLLDVLEKALNDRKKDEEIECFDCQVAEIGLCFSCLKRKVQE